MLFLAGCQGMSQQTAEQDVSSPDTAKVTEHPASTQSISLEPIRGAQSGRLIEPVTLPPADLWQRLRMQLEWHSIDNPQVAAARDHILQQPTYLDVIAARSELYLHYIVSEVEARGMPAEIALLPLVESTMDPFANSPRHAAGLWQIMPATGRHLGLTSNWWYDGRRDLRDSTRVALDYLEALHAGFDGDWLLALAAYNSGKGRVSRAIKYNRKRGKPTDYWSLNLPRETREYVPKLVALTSIIATPELYAATLPPVANAPSFAIASTGGQIEVSRAAQLAGVDEGLLRALNPGQLRWATAPKQPQELLLPLSALDRFEAGVAGLTDADRVRWRHYRIRRGDNLGSIARKFGTEVAMLKDVNKIRGSFIRAGDTLLIPQNSSWAASLALESGGLPKTRDYQVRRGDSLYGIAARFNVSIADIVSWNSLDPGAYLQPGQQLTLYLGSGG